MEWTDVKVAEVEYAGVEDGDKSSWWSFVVMVMTCVDLVCPSMMSVIILRGK